MVLATKTIILNKNYTYVNLHIKYIIFYFDKPLIKVEKQEKIKNLKMKSRIKLDKWNSIPEAGYAASIGRPWSSGGHTDYYSVAI